MVGGGSRLNWQEKNSDNVFFYICLVLNLFYSFKEVVKL